MRCPSCRDEYESHVRRCADCQVDLVGDDEDLDGLGDQVPAPTRRELEERSSSRHLGRFHPVMADQVVALLEEREIAYTVHTYDDHTEVSVGAAWRDDVRAELVVRWDELLAEIETDGGPAVLADDSHAPGWLDAPVGGYIDRDGRLVVDEPDEDDPDGSRTLGPALLVGGAILAVAGWQLTDLAVLTLVGVGLMLLGLFVTR